VWGDEIGLVVTDLVLPGKSGMELARGFRGQRADLPIVFVSGYDEDLESEGGLLPELSAFLAKPLSRDRLLQTVRRLLATVEVRRAGRGRP
jgi:DNA-binding response OmpR family regulator